MILAIDIGNTNIKIGVFDKDVLKGSFRLSSVVKRTSDEYGVDILTQLHRLFEGKKAKEIVTGIILGSVNPNLNYTFVRMSEYYFGIQPLVVDTLCKSNIDFGEYKNLGADRIANCEGAFFYDALSCSQIVIDCGTATTFNCVVHGKFMGGAIMPGVNTALDSLCTVAAMLPQVPLQIPSKAIATTTMTNIQAGILFGHIGAIEYLVEKMKKEILDTRGAECATKVIATGGLSELIATHSKVFDRIDRTLTLRGLCSLYQKNRVSKAQRNM